MASPAAYPIESVDNAAQILLMLRETPDLRVASIATHLGVARSTAHRMLTTLQARDLLRQDPVTKAYRAGSALVDIGLAVIGAADLRIDARAEMERLAAATGETVHLLVLEGTEAVFVEGVEGRHAIRAAVRTGHRSPAHASAAGKVMLAELSRADLRSRYPGAVLRGGTPRALQSRTDLEAELERVRDRGYALNHSESEPNLTAVAMAVKDAQGRLRGAMSVSGPEQRLGENPEVVVPALRAAIEALSARLL